MLARRRESGDTLVEVLLAFAILSAVSVGVFGLMNKGVSESYGALESSQVRTSINQQSELLTYFRDSYATARANGTALSTYPYVVWGDSATGIKAKAVANRGASTAAFDDCSTVMANSFYLSYDQSLSRYVVSNYTSANPPTLATPGAGLWIEPVASPVGATPGYQPYIDFYIKACWNPINNSEKQNASTVVRLYEQP